MEAEMTGFLEDLSEILEKQKILVAQTKAVIKYSERVIEDIDSIPNCDPFLREKRDELAKLVEQSKQFLAEHVGRKR
jgi:hypothetical protein